MKEIYIPGGYIMLSRKIIESEIWDKPPLYLKVWIYILTKARHEETKDYERGELLISIPELQEACTHKIGFRKETPSKKQIFTILEWLRNPHEGVHDGNDEKDTKVTMIGTTKTTRGLIVKVHNYNVYQSSKNYERNNEGNDESSSKETVEGERREREGNTIHKNLKKKTSKNLNHHQSVSDEDFKKIADYYNKTIQALNGTDYVHLGEDVEKFGKELVCKAIQEAARNSAQKYSYINRVLIDWSKNGVKTKEDAEQYLLKRQHSFNNKNKWQKEDEHHSPYQDMEFAEIPDDSLPF